MVLFGKTATLSASGDDVASSLVERFRLALFWLRFATQRCFFAILGILVFLAIVVHMIVRDHVMLVTSSTASSGNKEARPYSVSTSSRSSGSWCWSSVWKFCTGHTSTVLAWVSDTVVYVSQLSPVSSSLATRLFRYNYPPPFSAVSIPVGGGDSSEDDLSIFCRVALQPTTTTSDSKKDEAARMTIILVPGMLNASSMAIIVSLATELYYNWGANVIVCEMRGFAEMGRCKGNLPPSLSVFEARDILEVAAYANKHYKQDGIFLLGLSLGGTYALSAAASDKNQLIKASALVSAPMDLMALVNRMSQPCLTPSFNMFFTLYKWLLMVHCKLRGQAHDFRSFVDQIIVPAYPNFDPHRASPIHRLEGLSSPVLAIYAEDDPVTTIYEASVLGDHSRASKKEHLIEIHLTPAGGHAGHFFADNAGTSQKIYGFFERQLPKKKKVV